MNNELEEILQFYEEERQNLESLIHLHVKDFEYKKAHFHQKALYKVNQTLSLLRKFENPNYEEIEHLQHLLENYSNREFIELIEQHPYLSEKINLEKKHYEEKINQLRQEPRPRQIDGQEFDDVIFKLVENKIGGFHFFLNLETYLYLNFTKKDNFIIISVPKFKKLKKKYILRKSDIRALKAIGLKLDDARKSLVYRYDVAQFKDAIVIKTITSRIIYEGFHYSQLKNSTLIKIID